MTDQNDLTNEINEDMSNVSEVALDSCKYVPKRTLDLTMETIELYVYIESYLFVNRRLVQVETSTQFNNLLWEHRY